MEKNQSDRTAAPGIATMPPEIVLGNIAGHCSLRDMECLSRANRNLWEMWSASCDREAGLRSAVAFIVLCTALPRNDFLVRLGWRVAALSACVTAMRSVCGASTVSEQNRACLFFLNRLSRMIANESTRVPVLCLCSASTYAALDTRSRADFCPLSSSSAAATSAAVSLAFPLASLPCVAALMGVTRTLLDSSTGAPAYETWHAMLTFLFWFVTSSVLFAACRVAGERCCRMLQAEVDRRRDRQLLLSRCRFLFSRAVCELSLARLVSTVDKGPS